MASLGLEPGIVRLVDYTAEWAGLFAAEKARLAATLQPFGALIVDIQHVGSTAIPGLAAKPILDIAVAVQDFEAARVCVPPLAALGYEFKGEFGIPRRHYFVLGNPRTVHLHMNEAGSRAWLDHLQFRDTLIARPELRDAYQALKLDLARRHPHDRDSYLDGKAAFIEAILQEKRRQQP